MHHEDTTVTPEEVSIPSGHALAKLPPILTGVGAVLLAAVLALGWGDGSFAPSYLVAFLFFLSLGLGGLFFTLSQLASRAGWSVAVRRLTEHVGATLPLFALLFLPIAFSLPTLFEWARPEVVEHDALIREKQPYLNAGFFYVRAAIYFVVWAFLGWWFRKESLRQDREGAPGITRRLQTVSAPALLAFALTVTFASFDWIMSLSPHWFSTIFGVYYFSGAAVGIFSLLAILALVLTRADLLAGAVTVEHLHDVGKLLFAFVVFWAYIAFSQFMLIWYGNIPEETAFFADRWNEGWRPVSIALAAGHFVLPFVLLLLRGVKRRAGTLAAAGGWMLAMHYLDLYWLVMPTFRPESPAPTLLDLVAFLALGGVFLGALGLLMRRPALVPVRDPRLSESLSFENM